MTSRMGPYSSRLSASPEGGHFWGKVGGFLRWGKEYFEVYPIAWTTFARDTDQEEKRATGELKRDTRSNMHDAA